jgi:6-phosphogluconolactonase
LREVHVRPDLETLSLAVAETLVQQISDAVERRGRCALVLTGGRTPRRLYELLGERFATGVPWPQVDLFWCDERYVSPDDLRSNYRLARLALLDRISIAREHIHPMPTRFSAPDDAAREYETLIRGYFKDRPPQFDLLLLGMAANGHVASLFPHHPALDERDRWIVAVTVAADPPQRLTMTFPLINQAAAVAFVVAGATKADAVRRAMQPGTTIEDVPAVGVAPEAGVVTWWIDATAAAGLGPAERHGESR